MFEPKKSIKQLIELSCGFNDNHTKVQLDFKGDIYTIEKDIGILLIKKDNKKIFE
ncbi:Uncharacterised protein [Campylobacter hyointestinalis subsp. hyointestinalis]|uniref:Uncharacterized protein n=1 Tax=Campylobacter hyointestinalis subsp. hyointestinalis TaxID=91352 RepID=A0A9W5AVK3_CAMHY|nr:hypothetical protein [Campylobacter hyointestinalis]CUU88645.1 Uncharacterised protein [Campylobacter hyointestinalis subsp. hyointestinalis]